MLRAAPILPGSACRLLVTPDARVLSTVNGAPLDVGLPIPDSAALVGVVVHQQVLAAALAGGAFTSPLGAAGGTQ